MVKNLLCVSVFQSTPPRGGRLKFYKIPKRILMFQSTPPRGGRHRMTQGISLRNDCFNPRPRVGGDLCVRM